MFTPRKHQDSWREALKFISSCPVCNTSYNTDEARLFAKTETATLVHIACPSCNSFFMAMILTLGQGLSSLGIVTDLSYEDAKRLHRGTPLTIDEVIESHEKIHSTHFIDSFTHLP
ncbi:MAG TPA: hypothetical protein VJA27_00875 [Patescibacteria group bacterium]|nr:hypothetical protein [Patescibacteria group bacterium]